MSRRFGCAGAGSWRLPFSPAVLRRIRSATPTSSARRTTRSASRASARSAPPTRTARPASSARRNKCVPKPECTTDQNCPAGHDLRLRQVHPQGLHRRRATAAPALGARTTSASPTPAPPTTTAARARAASPASAPRPRRTDDTCNWTPIHFGFNESTLDRRGPHPARTTLADCIKKGDVQEGHPRGPRRRARHRGVQPPALQPPRGEREEVPGGPGRRARRSWTPSATARTVLPARRERHRGRPGRRTAGSSSATRCAQSHAPRSARGPVPAGCFYSSEAGQDPRDAGGQAGQGSAAPSRRPRRRSWTSSFRASTRRSPRSPRPSTRSTRPRGGAGRTPACSCRR